MPRQLHFAQHDPSSLAAVGFLSRYREPTVSAYRDDLRCFWTWCADHDLTPLQARRSHLELHLRDLQDKGYAAATVAGCGNEPVPVIASAPGPAVVEVVVTPRSGPGEPVRPGQRHRLARDAQRLLDRLSELGELPDSEGCNADAGNTLDLTVRRPGEQQVRVRVEAFGCEAVAGWGEDRTDGKEVESLVFELLKRQRVASPVADPVPGPCPTPLWEQLTILRQPVPQWDALAVLDDQRPACPTPPSLRVCAGTARSGRGLDRRWSGW